MLDGVTIREKWIVTNWWEARAKFRLRSLRLRWSGRAAGAVVTIRGKFIITNALRRGPVQVPAGHDGVRPNAKGTRIRPQGRLGASWRFVGKRLYLIRG